MKNLAHYLLFYSLMNTALTFGQGTPAITTFSPSSGPAGTTVTITGTNFSTTPAENTVYFGAAKASVSSATVSQLVVNAPIGATYQPITVTVNGLTAYTSRPFNITFPFTGSIGTSFTYRTDFWAGYGTRWEVVCDLDGDGKNDVVAADEGGNFVSVFRNVSTPGYISWDSFQPKLDFPTGPGAYGIAAGDLDGDGKPDLVAANIDGTSLSVFYNTSTPGSISFSPAVEIAALANSNFVAIQDLDLDGKPEIAVASSNGYGEGYVSVFMNTSSVGSISFAVRVDFLAGHGGVWGVALNDVDGDGKTDMAVASGGDGIVSIFRNISIPGSINSGSFEPKIEFATGGGYPSIVLLADIDGDQKNDLIVGNTGDGSGGYTTSIFRNISSPGTINSSSFDAALNFPSSDSPWNPAVGDINGDGKLDLMVRKGGPSGMLSVFKNIGSPGIIAAESFSPPYLIETGGASLGITIADMDGDGKSDVTVSNEQWNVISVFRNLDLPEPSPPLALPATFVSNTGFEAEWSSVNNIYEYRLDVSTTDTFASFVNGFEDKAIYSGNVGTIRNTVAGLSPNKNYFYRVRAVGISGNSSTISVTTATHPQTYSPNVWVKQHGGLGNEEIQTMTSDDKGNIYAAGHFSGTLIIGSKTLVSKGEFDIFFVRFNDKGQVMWARSIGGSGQDNEVSLAVDSKGLYMTGQFAAEIDVDPGNGITQFTNEGQFYVNDGFFGRYNLEDGSLDWAHKLVDASTWSSSSIGVDHTGVYLTGRYNGAVDFDPGNRVALLTSQGEDIFLAKYSLKGQYIWAGSMGGYDWDSGYGLLVDASGVYINGRYGWGSDFDPSPGYYPLDGSGGFFGRYDLTTGNLIYVKSAGNGLIWGLGKHGKDLYICGEFDGMIDADPDGGMQIIGTDGFHSGLIGKYNKLDGSFRWAQNMTATAWIGPRKLNADGSGVYVNGYFGGSVDFDSGPTMANRTAVNGNAFVAYYESNGSLDWVKGIGGSGLASATSIASTLTDDGYFMGGLFVDTVNFDPYKGHAMLASNGGEDIFIARYRLTKKIRHDNDIDESPIACINNKSTTTLFPNPTEDILRIEWHGFGNDEPIEVRILDFFGTLIMSQTLSTDKNSIDVTRLPSGYHILQARQNEVLQTIRFKKK